MSEKKYEVIDNTLGYVIASRMDLDTALLLMKACCEKYYMESMTLTLKEMDKVVMEVEHEISD